MKSLDFSRYALTCCVAAAMLAGCGGSQPPVGAYAASALDVTRSGHQIFDYTGQRQTFTVPANVKWLTVDALGASGASPSGTDSAKAGASRPLFQ